MRTFFIYVVTGTFLAAAVATAAAAERLVVRNRPHPCLYGGPEVYAQAKERAAKFDWAREAYDATIKQADEFLASRTEVPNIGGTSRLAYICPTCGKALEYRDGKHICPECGKEYTGWPYDGIPAGRTHKHLIEGGLRSLGLAYLWTGDEKYALESRRILLSYADKYPTYPLCGKRGETGGISAARLDGQTLGEAAMLAQAAWGYDLVAGSPSLSKEDRDRIETRFLREGAKVCLRYKADRGNWQTYHNWALVSLGIVLDDQTLVDTALYDPTNGVMNQLEHSIVDDGFWWEEGSISYHYFALNALSETARACACAGLDLWKNPNLRLMYTAPIAYADPAGRFPGTGDGGRSGSLDRYASRYALAYAAMGDERLLSVARIEPNLFQLLWGPETLPKAEPPALRSRVFPSQGTVILRRGSGPMAWYVHLDYNTADAGHGHPDKLAAVTTALGKRQSFDYGSVTYGLPIYSEWYRQTLAHNTVTVDEAPSDPKATGRLLAFSDTPNDARTTVITTNAYPGTALTRTMILTDGYLVDVFQVSSDSERTFDWCWHNEGTGWLGLDTERLPGSLGAANGYQHLRDVDVADGEDTWHADFLQQGANLRLTMLGAEGTKVYLATPYTPAPRDTRVLLVRRKGKSATFVSVMEAYPERPSVTGLEAQQTGSGLVVRVTRGQATEEWNVQLPTGDVP